MSIPPEKEMSEHSNQSLKYIHGETLKDQKEKKTLTRKTYLYFSQMIFPGHIHNSTIRHPLWSHRSFSKALSNIRVIVFQKSHGIFPNSKIVILSRNW